MNRRMPYWSNADLERWLMYHTMRQCELHRMGEYRLAVMARREARRIGLAIMERVNAGTWDGFLLARNATQSYGSSLDCSSEHSS